GPSGAGVDDLYTPEINAGGTTSSVVATETYDDLKVDAIVHEIQSRDHTGLRRVGVPALFGMNFQAVSVAQKLFGYADADGTPSAELADALDHTDASLARILDALEDAGIAERTLVIVTAKHGQSPIDPSKHRIVNKSLLKNAVNSVAAEL